jgi:hypothetical protein
MSKSFYVSLVLSFFCLGCSTVNNSPKYNTAEDILFKTDCLKSGGKIQEYPAQGLCKCTIGINEIYNTQQGYTTVSNYSSLYDKDGYDKNGYNYLGYNKNGHNKDGYNRNGFDVKGINKDTLTIYDKNGYDYNGYNQFGFHTNGQNKNGILFKDYFKELCSNNVGKIGWNLQKDVPTCNINNQIIDGNVQGVQKLLAYSSMYNKDGFNKDGFNREGINKDTLTQYDKNGKNKDGLTKQEQMQKEHNDALLAIEKEKLALEKQKLQVQRSQAKAAQDEADAADLANFNQSMQNIQMNNQLQQLNNNMMLRNYKTRY